MIVPDKKTEAYLNEPVSPKRVLRLCRAGVLPSSDFLRAAALCRCDKKWGKFIALILRFFAGLSFLAAAFFLMIAKWAFFYRTGGFVCLVLLLIFCMCLRRKSAVADYVGAGLTGILVFLPDTVFATNSFLYEQFFLWFVLLLFWSLSSSRGGLRLLTFVVLNAAICLYGVLFALPSFVFSAMTFFVLAAVFDLSCLLFWEIFPFKTPEGKQKCFRLFALAGAMLFLTAAAGAQCFSARLPNSGDLAFLFCFLCSGAVGYLYVVRFYDQSVRRLTELFSVCWICLLLYRVFYAFDYSDELRRALFCTAVSVLIVVTLIGERLFVARVKGDKNVL